VRWARLGAFGTLAFDEDSAGSAAGLAALARTPEAGAAHGDGPHPKVRPVAVVRS